MWLILLAAAITAGSRLPETSIEPARLAGALKNGPVLIVAPGQRDAWRAVESPVPVLFEPRPTIGGSALVDASGYVRRFWKSAKAETIAAEVKAWLGGRAIYDAQCARCHGSDGRDLNYAGIKSLAGLGRKHDNARIIEMTEATGVVDMSSLTAADKRALAIYVSGL
jgi:cytochrome c553